MMKHTNHDSWWHERHTKPADMHTGFCSMRVAPVPARDTLWPRIALVVALMFALCLMLILALGW